MESTATKREARSYISRFNRQRTLLQQSQTSPRPQSNKETRKWRPGVNLGNLYAAQNAAEEGPRFSTIGTLNPFAHVGTHPLHVALVLIKEPQSIDNVTLQGIGHTLSQLSRLGLNCVVVLDHQTGSSTQKSNEKLVWRARILDQADRVTKAIDEHGGQGARYLDSIVGIVPSNVDLNSSARTRGQAQITNRNLLLAPLRKGIIPVIASIGYTLDTQVATKVHCNEVMLALTREFAGIFPSMAPEEDPLDVAERVANAQRQISLDRIIVLDRHGGIPSPERTNGSHVFINLEQEYEDILEELKSDQYIQSRRLLSTDLDSSSASAGNPSLKEVDYDIGAKINFFRDQIGPTKSSEKDTSVNAHVDNLQLVRNTLALLPPSSSGLLTAPEEATGSRRHLSSSTTPGVGTRSQRNPLIHNLLTDKPIFSSSLPSTRLSPTAFFPSSSGIHSSPTTFIKHGMPVTIVPDPRLRPWRPPTPSSPSLQLSDPRLDLPRLIHLIEDSFDRKLDLKHYLSRISSNLAGIIIAGCYEGGALLTWESPPNTEDQKRLVPYLDKFAVLKRSQGAGGVADIVFSAMVRDCFPEGVVWRSRRDNPVNKWYFERARGTWQLPVTEKKGPGWTMFWTMEGICKERFEDYAAVCEKVVPSWEDGKGVLD